MSNIYRMENADGEIRRERSMTTFHYSGEVYWDLDGFHFVFDESGRGPRRDWDFQGVARNAAERFVLESYRSPVLVVDETQGDLFIWIYGTKRCDRCHGTGHVAPGADTSPCRSCDGLGETDSRGGRFLGEQRAALERWREMLTVAMADGRRWYVRECVV